MPLVFVFLTFFVWSTSFTLGKATLEFAPPVFLTGVRMLLAGVILLGFLAVARREDLKIRKAHLFPLILLAVSGVYLTNVFEFWGLQYLTATKTCFIYSLSPFLSALFSYLQFKEKVTPRKFLGLGIGFLGFLPYLMQQSGSEGLLGGVSFLSWAEIALMVAVITSVYGWILLRKLGKDEGMSPVMANGSSMILGGCIALLHSFFVESWAPFPVSNYVGFFQGVALMILVSNIICYNLYGWLLKKFTATFLSFAGLMTPLFAAFFGWAFLGETVTWIFFLSIGIISIGLGIVYFEELRLGYFSTPAPTPAREN
ncbi:MAG: S-adenosylmethionine/S-adenosylhomocysteine transporter [Chlamydiae bacterium]|nr:S-adenosylmethionine/S-adenosylhomocysteine transporter [Chlamydiota bacterium]